MLSSSQVVDLAKKMNVPLVFCNFKDKLKSVKLEFNKSYIINMENAYSKDGKRNPGSHYTCFQVNKYPNGKKEGIYFDSFGMGPPQIVEKFVGGKIPHNDIDIQSLLNSACGYYCLAFLHFINSYEQRSKDLYSDANHFMALFDDLEKCHDHLKNEYTLKHFFRSADPKLRQPITVGEGPANPNTIITEDEDFKK